MGAIIGIICEMVTGHRLGPWMRMSMPDEPLLRFEHARCRWCRQGYVRPMPLADIDCTQWGRP